MKGYKIKIPVPRIDIKKSINRFNRKHGSFKYGRHKGAFGKPRWRRK
jgi:hypothetical protein